MELTLSGIGILFLLFAWNCAFLPALRGKCLDHLDDLREENAKFFGKNSTEDRAKVRRALDSLLSVQIENLDRVSIVGYMIFRHWRRVRPEQAEFFDAEIQDHFVTRDVQVTEFAERIRNESALAIFIFMGRKYSVLWIAAAAVVPFTLASKGYKALWQAADAVTRGLVEAGSDAEDQPQQTKRILEDSIFAMSHI